MSFFMARIFRARVNWTGFSGAPGYSVFHGLAFEADPLAEATTFSQGINNFLIAIANNLPVSVSVQVDPEVEVLEDSTGTLQEVVTVPTLAATQGTGNTTYSAASGAVVNWRTDFVRNGRRIRGRTFLVPLATASYDTDGTLLPAVRTDILNAATALMDYAGMQLVVYGRPTILDNDGVSGRVTAVSVPDMAAVLRSRRD